MSKTVSFLGLLILFLSLCGYTHAGSFQHNNDGTVTDTTTGLIWQLRGPREPMNWQTAREYCKTLTLAGYNDWRLPTGEELSSLSRYFWEETENYMAFFPDTRESFYWTSTEDSWMTGPCDPPGYASCRVFIKTDQPISLDGCKLNKYYIRAVRDSH